MSKFFEIFGKVSLVLLVLGSLTYVGFYFGSKTKSDSKQQEVKTELASKIITEEVIPSPTAMSEKQITISAGVSRSSGLSFDQYSISVPESWTNKKESQTALDEKLILEKDGYSISIFQAATGGALCLFKGDADFEGPSTKFDYFVEVTTLDNRLLRRSGEENGRSFTICQKAPDGSFQQPTNYGHISIKLPTAWDDEGLKEVDKIIKSLKKI